MRFVEKLAISANQTIGLQRKAGFDMHTISY